MRAGARRRHVIACVGDMDMAAENEPFDAQVNIRIGSDARLYHAQSRLKAVVENYARPICTKGFSRKSDATGLRSKPDTRWGGTKR